jgi:hypothetical protein
MAHSLLDLPDELLVAIVENYLFQPMLLRVQGQRVWPASPRAPLQIRQEDGKTLNRLVQTNKRLYGLFQGLLYSHVAVAPSNSPKFFDTLTKIPVLENQLVSLSTESLSNDELSRIFSLPNLSSLEIWSLPPFHAPLNHTTKHYKSTVQHLYLPRCFLFEAPLAEILSYPASLKTLEYDVYPLGFPDFFRDPQYGQPSWLLRALAPQQKTLERLAFTKYQHTVGGAPEITIERAIDLSNFTALKSLAISDLYLIGRRDTFRAEDLHLPPLLEDLQVLYGKRDVYCRGGYKTEIFGDDWVWLRGLLQSKRTSSEKLKRIDFISPDVPCVEDDPEFIRQDGVTKKPTPIQLVAAKVWTLPESVVSLAADAGVELNVVLRKDWGANYLYRCR